MYSKGPLLTVVMKPSVISSATPRPASMSTSVAMMGWIPSTAMSMPFQDPSTSATRSAATTAATTVPRLSGSPDPSMIVSATAPDTAMTAPTDRSMPRVAITIVMPRATSMSGALLRRMSISAP